VRNQDGWKESWDGRWRSGLYGELGNARVKILEQGLIERVEVGEVKYSGCSLGYSRRVGRAVEFIG
jgi:hypothetical protein